MGRMQDLNKWEGVLHSNYDTCEPHKRDVKLGPTSDSEQKGALKCKKYGTIQNLKDKSMFYLYIYIINTH